MGSFGNVLHVFTLLGVFDLACFPRCGTPDWWGVNPGALGYRYSVPAGRASLEWSAGGFRDSFACFYSVGASQWCTFEKPRDAVW